MKGLTAAVLLSMLALSACAGLAEKNPRANPFPQQSDQGLG
jgi:hypothetical protein